MIAFSDKVASQDKAIYEKASNLLIQFHAELTGYVFTRLLRWNTTMYLKTLSVQGILSYYDKSDVLGCDALYQNSETIRETSQVVKSR